jgi:hypothetical protein
LGIVICAVAEDHLELAERGVVVGGDPLVVVADGLEVVHVVPQRHLLVAHDGELADLAGVEPRGVGVADNVARIIQGEEADVLDFLLEEGARSGRRPRPRRAGRTKQEVEDGDVVAGEVVDGADVLAGPGPRLVRTASM